ncbi:MAG TPA: hypothetical protein VEB23_14435 [Ramlibacter sp.]|nr:hypothetical protein [Ramlibacter sp.]
MHDLVHLPVTVGKYLVSPLTQVLQNGWFASSVSIRAAGGAERILRLTRLFRDPLSAARYATGEGLQWIGAPRACAAA